MYPEFAGLAQLKFELSDTAVPHLRRLIRDVTRQLVSTFGHVKRTSESSLQGVLIGPPRSVAEFTEQLIQWSYNEWFSLTSLVVSPVHPRFQEPYYRAGFSIRRYRGKRSAVKSGESSDPSQASASSATSLSSVTRAYQLDTLTANDLKDLLADQDAEFHELAYIRESDFAKLTGYEACQLRKNDLIRLVPGLDDRVATRVFTFLRTPFSLSI
jgi:hypothetical protein